MVAQSLDLPPQAARWRHQQVHHQQRHATAKLQSMPWGRSGSEEPEDTDFEQIQPKDVRSRVAGMLEKERE